MLAATYQGPRKVRAQNVQDARLLKPTDAIVRSTVSAICGSDLHTYHGANEKYLKGAGLPPVLGHEYVGIVEEIGDAVRLVKKGDRVVGAFRSACGICDICSRGFPAMCPLGEMMGLDTPGAQAEAVRVPFADYTLAIVPDKVSDDHAIFVGDNMSTGMQAADYGRVRPGDTVAVFGCGPVGLFAQQAALLMGASRVFAVDRSQPRLQLAKTYGSEPVDASDGDTVARIRDMTQGRGVDVAIEAIGFPQTVIDCIHSVRPFGTVSMVGISESQTVAVPIRDAYMNGVQFVVGRCSAQKYMRAGLALIAAGRIDPTSLCGTKIPLETVADGYERFDTDKSVFKVLLRP